MTRPASSIAQSLIPDLNGQTALVTGAGRGIGQAITLALAECNATVYALSRSPGPLEQLLADAGDRAERIIPLTADLTDESAVIAAFEQLRRQHGRLDVLINNAGIGRFGPVAEFNTQDYAQVFDTNVRGAMLCAREAVKLMAPRQRGQIINIGSVVSFKGYANQAVYAASKHALLGLTRTLAAEAQPLGIKVSIIMPGGVDTDMVGDARPDLNREELLQPADIARTVLYLLSLPERAAIDQIYIRRSASSPF